MKKNLEQYKSLVIAQENARDAWEDRSMLDTLRMLLNLLETQRAIATRILFFFRWKDIRGGMRDARDEDKQKFVEGIKSARETLKAATLTYKNMLRIVMPLPENTLHRYFTALSDEYQGSSIHDGHMRNHLQLVRSHIDVSKKNGIGSITLKDILKKALGKEVLQNRDDAVIEEILSKELFPEKK
jgi:hypothetical protein